MNDLGGGHTIICPACLNFMSCTVCFCLCSGSTARISTIGARSVPSTEPRRTASGAGAVQALATRAQEVRALLREYGISARLASNSLLQKEHLRDPKCNALCALFEAGSGVQNGVIVHSELLLEYLKARYPGFYFVSSTTKVLTEFAQLRRGLEREEFRFVVPDFRLNNV